MARRKKPPVPDDPDSTALVSLRPSTLLQDTSKNGTVKPPFTMQTRKIFLKAYEANMGNVTIACRMAGICRQTYYRWLESPTRINQKFRQQLKRLRPEERLIDEAEFTVARGLAEGNMLAAIFTLKTRGRHRGWSERPETLAAMGDLLDRVAGAYRAWLEDHPEAALEEKIRWLGRFAENGKVPAQDLAKRVGLPLDAE